MSIDNIDFREEEGRIEIGLFDGEESRDVIPVSLEGALALRDALDKAILGATRGQSRWCCPNCHSLNVQVSFPTWFRETPDFTLLYCEVDGEADIQWWYCEDCDETGDGAPMEASELQ
jgi:hypothetical protein